MRYSVSLFWNRVGDLDFSAAAKIAWEQIRYLLFRSRSYSVFEWNPQRRPLAYPVPEEFKIQHVSSWEDLSEQEKQRICGIESGADLFFGQGAELWTGRYRGELAVVVWVWPEKAVREWFFPVPSGSAILNHCFTFPEYRGRGFYHATLQEIVQEKTAQGFAHLFVHCYTWNCHSIRGIQKAGFVFLGTGQKKKNSGLLWDPCIRNRPPEENDASGSNG